MKTLDGFELQEGDTCFVRVQDPMGEVKYGDKIFAAIYESDNAKYAGWDFEILELDSEVEVEVIAIWKNKPNETNDSPKGV